MFSSPRNITIDPPSEYPPGWSLLNRDVIELIASREMLPEPQDACHLAQASRFFYHGTKNILAIRRYEPITKLILVEPNLPNLKKVIAIMDSDPNSLEYKIHCSYDNVGRVFRHKTLFQLACASGDIELCRELKTVFIKHLGSEIEAKKAMKRQRDEMIGDVATFDKEEDEKIDHLLSLLQEVTDAIRSQTFDNIKGELILLNAHTLDKIKLFRVELDKILMTTDLGAHYTQLITSRVYEIYSQLAKDWHYHYYPCFLFEDAVLAPLLSYLPANDEYNCSAGLTNYNADLPFEEIVSTMRSRGKNIGDVVRGPSLNFLMSGAYFDTFSGSAADISGVFQMDDRIPKKCEIAIAYFDFKIHEFDFLFSLPEEKDEQINSLSPGS